MHIFVTCFRTALARMRESFLLIPGLELVIALALGIMVPQFEPGLGEYSNPVLDIFSMMPESAQALLAAIAGAMATIAGIVFSITVVTLSVATAQLGPRLLRTFISNSVTKISLGAFVATSLYCLLVLASVSRNGDAVPRLGVMLAVLLTIFDLAMLVYFTHRIATLIQAPNTVRSVAAELDAVMEELYPQPLRNPREHVIGDADIQKQVAALGDGFSQVKARNEGYIQEIEYTHLIRLAAREDVIIHLSCRPGHFLSREAWLAMVWPAERCVERLARRINAAVVYGNRPTPRQDVEAAVQELVEVAVRALSPGINDPFTAIQCIDRLGATLGRLAMREVPSPFLCDENGQLRVITQTVLFSDVLDTAYNPLRQFSKGILPVSIRLLELLGVIARQASRPDDLEAILLQAKMILNAFDLIQGQEARDAADMHERFDRVAGLIRQRRGAEEAPAPVSL